MVGMIGLIFCINLLQSINTTYIVGYLNIKSYPVGKYHLKLENEDAFFDLIKPKSTINEHYGGYLCHAENLTDFEDNCAKKYSGFNENWIVLVNNTEFFKDINNFLNRDFSKLGYKIKSVISSFSTSDVNQNNLDSFVLILTVNLTAFNNLSDYSIRKAKNNNHFNLFYEYKPSILFGKIIFYFECVLLLGILLFFIYYYYITFKKYARQSNQLNKIIFIVLVLRFFLTGVFGYLLLYEYIITASSGQYLIVIYQTINALSLAFYWTIIYVISEGFSIFYFNIINTKNFKPKVIFLIVTYVILFISPFLNKILTYKLTKFLISDIINTVVFLILSTITTISLTKIYKKIRSKLSFATEFAPEYCDSLKLKLEMLGKLLLLSFSFPVVYIILTLFYRLLEKHFLIYYFDFILKSFEDVYIFLFLYTFRSRIYPRFFNDLLDDRDNDDIKIYRIVVPKLSSLISDQNFGINVNCFNPNSTLNGEFPVILINPIFDKNDIVPDKVIDHISIGLNKDEDN